MARGKKAASAANHRLEAARDHVDRLTDQLVEAKLRARKHERAAEKLPMVEAELARVRRLAEEGTSDALIDERRRCAERVAAAEAELAEVRQVASEIITAAQAAGVVVMPADRLRLIADQGLAEQALVDLGVSNRANRRVRATRRSSLHRGDSRVQDNLRTQGQNIDRAVAGLALPKAPVPGEVHRNDEGPFEGTPLGGQIE